MLSRQCGRFQSTLVWTQFYVNLWIRDLKGKFRNHFVYWKQCKNSLWIPFLCRARPTIHITVAKKAWTVEAKSPRCGDRKLCEGQIQAFDWFSFSHSPSSDTWHKILKLIESDYKISVYYHDLKSL
jgi:hypothetical protein